jgi:pilus assembly protein Flp/PilA
MSQFIKSFNRSVRTFIQEEEGSQVVEYALIIAVVSIGVVVALGGSTSGGLQGAFTALVDRVTDCLDGTAC